MQCIVFNYNKNFLMKSLKLLNGMRNNCSTPRIKSLILWIINYKIALMFQCVQIVNRREKFHFQINVYIRGIWKCTYNVHEYTPHDLWAIRPTVCRTLKGEFFSLLSPRQSGVSIKFDEIIKIISRIWLAYRRDSLW